MRIMRASSVVLSLPLLLLACTDDEPSQPDVGEPHCAATGALADQTLANGDGVEDRAYFLYVPVEYRCDAPIALLVDFHGTAGEPSPETAYANEDFIALAEEHGVLVVRLRSRSRVYSGGNLYQWDANQGDIARNMHFARTLVGDLQTRFPIDPERIYATGFSSGANMSSQFIGDPTSPFRGIAPIAGGDWTRQSVPTITAPTRLYLATGYRDYLWPYAKKTADSSKRAGLADADLFVRRSSSGHEIHAWQLHELWRFLDAGERPPAGVLDPTWTRESLPDPADVNAFAIDGTTFVAAGANGHVWRRDGAWSVERQRPSTDYVSLCFVNDRGFVGGLSTSARHENGAWTDLAPVPDYGGMLGAGWINDIDCRTDGSIVVGGYWSQAISSDGGVTWSRLTATTGFGFEAQVASIATSSSGATVLAGNYFLGRAAPGATTASAAASPRQWINAVTASGTRFWAVGDGGQIWASENDGASWFEQQSTTIEDLYAVHFVDAQHGAVAGRSGTVLVTEDGGTTWATRALGLTTTLGAIHLDATSIWVGGHDGLVAHAPR
jgi:poly(3-hydroxybutyrate) depolymerase